MKLIFCMQINIKVSYKLILTLLAPKFPTRWYYQYWWTWSSILKVLKVTSFAISSQYLKKEVRDGVHFLYANKNQSFYKLALLFLMEVARHVQSTQNRKLVMFLKYIKKKVSELFLCSMGPYIYDVHMEGVLGSLEICHVFADSIAFKR